MDRLGHPGQKHRQEVAAPEHRVNRLRGMEQVQHRFRIEIEEDTA